MEPLYVKVAQDIRRRIRDGEWATGSRLPTLHQLRDDYEGASTSTIRGGMQTLVDEGLVETRHGVGSYVLAAPAPEDTAAKSALRDLREVQHLAKRVQGVLEDCVNVRPVPVELKRPKVPITEVWGHAEGIFCRTCGEDLGGHPRGWITLEEFTESRISCGGHDDLEEHQIVHFYGSPDEDQDEGRRRELWWERYAHLLKAAESLLAGDQSRALQHAQHAQQVMDADPAVDQLCISIDPRRE